ncbi:MAG: hypothetical protein QOE92_913 [Chloroflexota bacterium]|nr:hypothetical protein [Chloroflexota bacterium]
MLDQGAIGQALERAVMSLEKLEALDPISDAVAGVVKKVFQPRALKNLVSGTWLGHQLHPVLTDLPIGFWTAAITLDMIGGEDAESSADLLVTLGNLSALGAAATGLADWSELYGAPQRSGMVHALTNVTSLSLFTLSALARNTGNRGTGKVLALAGGGVAAAAAYLGGHLVYRRGAGVIHAGFEIDQDIADWAAAGPEADLEENTPKKVKVKGAAIFLLKQDGVVHALANTCTHMGGPLNEGQVEGDSIVCPWHQSTFRVADGCVLRGPAASPQPAFETRVRDGVVEIRAAGQ